MKRSQTAEAFDAGGLEQVHRLPAAPSMKIGQEKVEAVFPFAVVLPALPLPVL